ncbi:UBX domain-containing protein 6 [Aphelenchoides besseyi]|nr:UBX domain-containing protein 6 [Aphelenchoides besseyi]
MSDIVQEITADEENTSSALRHPLWIAVTIWDFLIWFVLVIMANKEHAMIFQEYDNGNCNLMDMESSEWPLVKIVMILIELLVIIFLLCCLPSLSRDLYRSNRLPTYMKFLIGMLIFSQSANQILRLVQIVITRPNFQQTFAVTFFYTFMLREVCSYVQPLVLTFVTTLLLAEILSCSFRQSATKFRFAAPIFFLSPIISTAFVSTMNVLSTPIEKMFTIRFFVYFLLFLLQIFVSFHSSRMSRRPNLNKKTQGIALRRSYRRAVRASRYMRVQLNIFAHFLPTSLAFYISYRIALPNCQAVWFQLGETAAELLITSSFMFSLFNFSHLIGGSVHRFIAHLMPSKRMVSTASTEPFAYNTETLNAQSDEMGCFCSKSRQSPKKVGRSTANRFENAGCGEVLGQSSGVNLTFGSSRPQRKNAVSTADATYQLSDFDYPLERQTVEELAANDHLEVNQREQRAVLADAANRRMNSQKNRGLTAGQRRIREEAQREYEAEKRRFSNSEKPFDKDDSVDHKMSEQSNAVASVLFTCQGLGNQKPMPKDKLLIKIEEVLRDRLISEPLESSIKMIWTLNERTRIDQGVQLLVRYINNVLADPSDPKFRSIKTSNKSYIEKILSLKGGPELMKAIGFLEQQDKNNEISLVLADPTDESLESLKYAIQSLEDGSALSIKLFRDPKVFRLDADKPIPQPEIPSDFFDLTIEELKKEQKQRTETVEQLCNLRTSHKNEGTSCRKFKGVFMTREKFGSVRQFLSEMLAEPSDQFVLTAPTAQTHFVDVERTLNDYDLVPTAVIHFAWSQDELDHLKSLGKEPSYLRAEYEQQASTL